MKKAKFFPFYFFSVIPFPFVYAFSDFLFFLIYYVFKYRRTVVESNLRSAFPQKTAEEIRKIKISFYKNFCDLFMEVNKSLSMSKMSISKRYKVLNPDLLERYFNENRSIIMYSGHMINWEWFCFLPLKIKHRVLAFYKKQSNGYFNDLVVQTRSNYGVECVDSKRGIRKLSRLNDEGKAFLCFIIGDQSPTEIIPTTHWTKFLNRETAFFSGAERIAQHLDLVLVYPKVMKKKRGVYEIEFQVITDRPQNKENGELIDSYSSLLESNIKSSPSLWLWSHKRWKHSKKNQSEEILIPEREHIDKSIV